MELPNRTDQELDDIFSDFTSEYTVLPYKGKTYIDPEYGEVPLQSMRYEFVHFNGKWQFELDDRENEYVITLFPGPSSDDKIFFGFSSSLERKKFVQNLTINGKITQVSTGMNLESVISQSQKIYTSGYNRIKSAAISIAGIASIIGIYKILNKR